MAATTDYINSLKQDKANLVNNLIEKGVEATDEETFTSLVPKVLDIQSGGGTTVEKGLIINAYDSSGYATDISIVGITSIPSYYCYNSGNGAGFLGKITNVNFKEDITSIGSYAFNYCKQLVLKELPNTITQINAYAFQNCTNLALTSLPPNLTKIENYTFASCSNLALTDLPSKITSIGSYAFSGCSKMKLNELSDSITSIGSYAFQSCNQLTWKKLPNKLTKIDNSTFTGCTSLTELDILSNTLSSIGTYAFSNCSNLSKIIFRTKTAPTLANKNAFNNTPIANGTGYIYFDDEIAETMKTATNWSTYANQIKGVSELV